MISEVFEKPGPFNKVLVRLRDAAEIDADGKDADRKLRAVVAFVEAKLSPEQVGNLFDQCAAVLTKPTAGGALIEVVLLLTDFAAETLGAEIRAFGLSDKLDKIRKEAEFIREEVREAWHIGTFVFTGDAELDSMRLVQVLEQGSAESMDKDAFRVYIGTLADALRERASVDVD